MDAPVCHLNLEHDKHRFVYSYECEKYLVANFTSPATCKRGSDADIQVDPPLYQLVFEVEEDCDFTVTIMPKDGIVLKPARAADGQAILSQVGKPLIYGVNGLYDMDSDMYITWHGFAWSYEGTAICREMDRDKVVMKGRATKGNAIVFVVYQQYYQKHLGYEFHNPRQFRHNPKPICGWATWEAFRFDVSINNLRESVDFLAENLKDYGLEFIQLDDGYQPTYMPPKGSNLIEGWSNCNEKFPEGHKSILDAIRSKGFEAALWLNATIHNEEYAQEKCLKDKDGNLLKQPWINYVFDCMEESCREIEELYKHLANMGYSYFKVDAIRHLMYDGLQVAAGMGLLTNNDAINRFKNYMGSIRKGIGPDTYLLSCWGMLTPNIGICDAMRFATDASATDYSFRMQIDESARWHHTHGILYLNDPDYICLRMDAAPSRSIASIISLNGYLYMISDEISHYNDEKLSIARKTISPTIAITAETGILGTVIPMNTYKTMTFPRDGEHALSFGNIWATHFNLHERQWCVVNLIRTAEYKAPSQIEIPMENLGLAPEKEYAVFDFWNQQPKGVIKGSALLDVPEYRDCTVLSFTPVSGDIDLVGSSRHVSMDTVSIEAISRKEHILELTVTGPSGTTVDYWFFAPVELLAEGGTIAKVSDFFKCTVVYRDSPQKLILRRP
ncbi:MAG: alpha-galactosidase [Defluviitaleaceae bacterium]|nr:alpha-galactosidase [Defluviitaleaceae bacterium]